jgi:hypothetical protein
MKNQQNQFLNALTISLIASVVMILVGAYLTRDAVDTLILYLISPIFGVTAVLMTMFFKGRMPVRMK